MKREILFAQHLKARPDMNDRPRELYIGYGRDEDGEIRALEAYDAPHGKPAAYYHGTLLLGHHIPAQDYYNLRAMFERKGTLYVQDEGNPHPLRA